MKRERREESGFLEEWCWSWSSNTLTSWCEEPTHWKIPWCWERLKAGGEGNDRGWDGWHHWLDGHEFEQAPGVGEGQGGLACCSPVAESDRAEQLNRTEEQVYSSFFPGNINFYLEGINNMKLYRGYTASIYFLTFGEGISGRKIHEYIKLIL